MLNDRSTCVMDRKFVNRPFDAAEFLAAATELAVPMLPSEGWIRSGARIDEQYKGFISSYRLLGGAQLCYGRARFEALLVKTPICIGAEEAEAACVGLVCRHLRESGADVAFVALNSPKESGFLSLVVLSPATCEFDIPADVLEYITLSAIKKHLASSTGLSRSVLDGFFSKGYALFDDSAVRARARDMDKALRYMKFCDIATGSGQITRAMAEETVKARLSLNRYINGTERTRERFMAHFISHSLYATDCAAGAVEAARLAARLAVGADGLNDSHIVWGNVLTEKLFCDTHFDVIVTNPPHMKPEQFAALRGQLDGYLCCDSAADLYCYYIERCFELARARGTVAWLASDRWMRAGYGEKLRAMLADKNITDIVDYSGISVVQGFATPLCAVTAGNEPSEGSFRSVEVTGRLREPLALYAEENYAEHDSALLSGRTAWSYDVDGAGELLNRIAKEGVPLSEYVNGGVYRGILTGLNEAFVISAEQARELIAQNQANAALIRPFLSGRHVKRYQTPVVKKYLITIPKGTTDRERGTMEPEEWLVFAYPDIARLLAPHERKAARRRDKGDYWWELRSCRYYDAFAKPKIVCPSIVNRMSAFMDNGGLLSNDKTSIITSDSYYLLGLLNSKLMDFCFRRLASALLNGYYELKPALLSSLPIKRISPTNSAQLRMRDEIARCAERMSSDVQNSALELRKTERTLDSFVYKLYHIKPSDISIIENY